MTKGISPKAVLAFVFPFLATCLGVLATWVESGEFNGQEIRTAAAGLIAAAVAWLGAYLGRPGDVVEDRGSRSDDVLGDPNPPENMVGPAKPPKR